MKMATSWTLNDYASFADDMWDAVEDLNAAFQLVRLVKGTIDKGDPFDPAKDWPALSAALDTLSIAMYNVRDTAEAPFITIVDDTAASNA